MRTMNPVESAAANKERDDEVREFSNSEYCDDDETLMNLAYFEIEYHEAMAKAVKANQACEDARVKFITEQKKAGVL